MLCCFISHSDLFGIISNCWDWLHVIVFHKTYNNAIICDIRYLFTHLNCLHLLNKPKIISVCVCASLSWIYMYICATASQLVSILLLQQYSYTFLLRFYCDNWKNKNINKHFYKSLKFNINKWENYNLNKDFNDGY